MPENLLTGHIGRGNAQATVSNTLRAELLPVIEQLEGAFGKKAVAGEEIAARFIGTAEQKVPFSGHLYDVMQRPELYDLTEAQRALLASLQEARSMNFNKFREFYGLEIGEFPTKPGAVHLANVGKSETDIQMAGSLEAAMRRGRAKERIYETGADRWLADTAAGREPFEPALDIRALLAADDEELARLAGQRVFEEAIGGRTKLTVLQETHTNLYNQMTGLRAKLQSLKGTAGRLNTKLDIAIDDFLASPLDDIDLANLRNELDVKLARGPRVGKDIKAIQTEIDATKAKITGLQPAWRTANLKPYTRVQEAGNLYFPVSEAETLRYLTEVNKNRFYRVLDDARATAFGGDFSPATIQGLSAWSYDPVGVSKFIAREAQGSYKEGKFLRMFSEAELAADVRNDPEIWQLFTEATGLNPLGGMAKTEFGTGFLAKIPKVGKYWEAFNESVYRPLSKLTKESFKTTYLDGLKMGLSKEQATAVAADDVTKMIPHYSWRRLGLSQKQSTQYRAALTSVSFLTQPAALMTDATKGLLKLGVGKAITPTERFALKRVLTAVALWEGVAVASHVYYAKRKGQDLVEAAKDSVNPDSGYFMSAVLPNGDKIGLGGPIRSWIRATYPRPVKGVPFPLPFKGFYDFAQSKVQPLLRVIQDEIKNKDYYGRAIRTGTFPYNVVEGFLYAGTGIMPLTAGTAVEEIRRGTPGQKIPAQVISQFAGVNLAPENRAYELKRKWSSEPDWKAFEQIPTSALEVKAARMLSREQYRARNPLIDAKLFIAGNVNSLQSFAGAQEAFKLAKENQVDFQDIKGIQAVQDEARKREELGLPPAEMTPTNFFVSLVEREQNAKKLEP
ncbi:MAG: hypothetical protein Q8K68_13235, partial [Nitrospirota bacterium]|nr:hypothetical protein [Nitrospirota bacterium]